MHRSKSCGPDNILNEFLMGGKDVLCKYLHTIFNVIFQSGHFPQSWSDGIIIPLHKKGSIHEVNNYRDITLLSCLGKLFTKILNSRLTEWAENYYIYIEGQAGFRSGMGTVDNIFVLHSLITHFINNGSKLFCAFVDFSKAFDYVVRDNLWYKLIQLGVRGNMLNIIRSMYKCTKSFVKSFGSLSEPFICQTGVRQGESLSPFLFAMYINDLEEVFITKGVAGIDTGLMELFILLYADDIVLMAENEADLQHCLEVLHEYCTRWKLSVNASKTKIVVFHKGRLPNNIHFKYGEQNIEIVTNFFYLGAVFTCGGSFMEMQKTLAGYAQNAVFKMKRYLQSFVSLKPSHVCSIFDKLIHPVLNYSCEVWGFIQATAIERVHLKFCKQLLGVKQSCQNDFVYGELGRFPLIVHRHYRIVKYWLKILKLPDRKYVKLCYKMLLYDADINPNKKNWAISVRELLFHLGYGHIWLSQSVGDEKLFLCQLRQRLQDVSMQEWYARINESSRASLYKHAFDVFGYKLYLDIVSIEKFRFSLTRLRTSSHRLCIEAGRWAKSNPIVLENRKCFQCDDIEDEYHFVLVCPVYRELRRQFIPQYYRTNPSMFKFIELLKSDQQSILRNFAMYCEKAFHQRNVCLYG